MISLGITTLIEQIVSGLYAKQSVLSLHQLISLVKAIIMVESGGNPNAINCNTKRECSIGLGQININVHKVTKEEMLDPANNIQFVTNYLIYQLNRYGSTYKAVSAYNAGSFIWANTLYVNKVMALYNGYVLVSPSPIIPSVTEPQTTPISNVVMNRAQGLLILLFYGIATWFIVKGIKFGISGVRRRSLPAYEETR